MADAPLSFRQKVLLALITVGGGIVVAILSPMVISWIRPHDPLPKVFADIYCSPATAQVGQTVRCTNQSKYADGYIWKFGDGTGPLEKKDGQPVDHIFNSPGPKTILLTAYNRAGKHEHPFDITVESPPADLVPVRITVTVTFKPELKDRSRSIDIDESAEQEPGVAEQQPHTYLRTARASPGYRIAQADFASTNQHSAHQKFIDHRGLTVELPPNPRVEILEGGTAVQLTLHLRTGPEKTHTKAWVKGSLTFKERLKKGDTAEIFKNLHIDHYGTYLIEGDANVLVPESFRLADSSGQIFAAGNADTSLFWPVGKLKFSLTFGENSYQLQVDRMFTPPPDPTDRMATP